MANQNIDNAKGRAQEAAGTVSGNKRLENEGRADRAKGSVKNAIDKSYSLGGHNKRGKLG